MKKIAYAVCGTGLVSLAMILQRVDGGGGDVVVVMLLGIGLLFASADVTTRKRVA